MDYVRDNHPWTDAEISLLLRAFCDGVAISDIAQRHLRTPLAIELELIELKMVEPYGGATLAEAEYSYLIAAEPGNEEPEQPERSKRHAWRTEEAASVPRQSQDIYDNATRLSGSWENGKRR